jgi:hypothetical protein
MHLSRLRLGDRGPTAGRGFKIWARRVCPAHSAAIEAVINEGDLEDPDNDLG